MLHQKNPILKVRDMNGSMQVTIIAELARELNIDKETHVEEILQSDHTLLLRFVKPTWKQVKKEKVAGQGNQEEGSIPSRAKASDIQ